MTNIPGLAGALGDLQVQLPAKLFLEIAEQLGSYIVTNELQEIIQNSTDPDVPEEEVSFELKRVATYIQECPSMSMLNASMVNRYFRGLILGTTLRWDANSENPMAIYHAASRNYTNLLQHALAQNGAQPDHVPTGHGGPQMSPVMVAAWRGHLESVAMLLDRTVDIHEPIGWENNWRAMTLVESPTTMLSQALMVNDFAQWTPLHAAVLAPHNAAQIANLLLDRLSPQFAKDHIEQPRERLFAHAVARDLVDLVEPLMQRGARPDHGGATYHNMQLPVLHHAVSAAMVRKLVAAGADVHSPRGLGVNALHAVCLRQTDCTGAIQELVKLGVDVNETTAGGRERATIVETDPNGPLVWGTPHTPLNLACRQLNLDHIKVLLQSGANATGTNHDVEACRSNPINGERWQASPFHDLFLPENLASNPNAGDGEKLSQILRKATVALIQYGGRDALRRSHLVCIYGRLEAKIAREFWFRSSVGTCKFGSYTPLQLFFMQPLVDDDRIPEAMWNAADIKDQINSVVEPLGVTPLIALLSHRFDHSLGEAKFYRPNLVRWLLDHGANPDQCDEQGFSPLHYAAFWLDSEAIALLLQCGADASGTDRLPGLRPLDVVVGGIYTVLQRGEMGDPTTDARETAWKTMVNLLDRVEEQPYGLLEGIVRWKEGYQLPMCAVPNFETRLVFENDEAAPAHMRVPDFRATYRTQVDTQKALILQLLLAAPQTRRDNRSMLGAGDAALDDAYATHQGMTLREIDNEYPFEKYKTSTALDYACATNQHSTLKHDLCKAGFQLSKCPHGLKFWAMPQDVLWNNYIRAYHVLMMSPLYPCV